MKTAKWIFYVLGVSGALVATTAVVFFSEMSSVSGAFTTSMWWMLPIEVQVLMVFFCIVVPVILFIEAFT